MSLLDDEESVNATVEVLSTNFTSLKELFRTYATGTKGKVWSKELGYFQGVPVKSFIVSLFLVYKYIVMIHFLAPMFFERSIG